MNHTIEITGIELREIISKYLNLGVDKMDMEILIDIPDIGEIGGRPVTDISRKNFTVRYNK